ncbi:MAG: hypothetical protein RIB60_06155 [Phycisphaerales bacterium]
MKDGQRIKFEPGTFTKCDNLRMNRSGDTAYITMEYPRNEGEIGKLILDISECRAADGIRVSYDFKRDGWKIEQASRFCWPSGDEVCDPDWQEVAFVKAWGREDEEWERRAMTGQTDTPDPMSPA